MTRSTTVRRTSHRTGSRYACTAMLAAAALTVAACSEDASPTAGDGANVEAPQGPSEEAPSAGEGGSGGADGSGVDDASASDAPSPGAEDGAETSSGLTVLDPDGAELSPTWEATADLAAPVDGSVNVTEVPGEGIEHESGETGTNIIMSAGATARPLAWSQTTDDVTLVEHGPDGTAEEVPYTLETTTDIGAAQPADMVPHTDGERVLWTAVGDEGTRLMALDAAEETATELASTADGGLGETIVGVADSGIVTVDGEGNLYLTAEDEGTTELGTTAEVLAGSGGTDARTSAVDEDTLLLTRSEDTSVTVEALDLSDPGAEPGEVATIEVEGPSASAEIASSDGTAVVTVTPGAGIDQQAVVLDPEVVELVGVVEAPGTTISAATGHGYVWVAAATPAEGDGMVAEDGGLFLVSIEDGSVERVLDTPLSRADHRGSTFVAHQGLGEPGDGGIAASLGQ